MSYSRLLAIIAMALASPLRGGAQSSAESCLIAHSERHRLLGLSLEAFDQQRDSGFRAVANLRCFAAAATLVDEYVQQHRSQLSPRQIGLLRWHAGQLYAYAGNSSVARARMLDAIDLEEPEPPFFPWNDYVRATIAFIDGNRDLLLQHRERIAATVSKGNLNIVDKLIECFGRPYLEASPYAP